SEQKTLAAQTAAADVRLRDAIETIPEAFVLWDAENRLVLCNSNFQALHNLPDESIAAGMPYERIIASEPKPAVRTHATRLARGPSPAYARTCAAWPVNEVHLFAQPGDLDPLARPAVASASMPEETVKAASAGDPGARTFEVQLDD